MAERPKEDRRIRRSRRMLKNALAELMQEKDFKDITVKDITDRADLNRGTFYLHYTDTYDLLEKIQNDVLEDFQRMIDDYLPETDTTSVRPVIAPIAEYIMENKEICRCLFGGKTASDFLLKFRKLISDNGAEVVARRFGSGHEAQTARYEYLFGFITYGVLGVVKQWFDEGSVFPMSELIDMVDRLISSAALSLMTESVK